MADDKMSERKEVEMAVGDREAHEDTMAQMKEATESSSISEKRLLLKTDLHVVPILFLLFLCAFIDRYALTVGHGNLI